MRLTFGWALVSDSVPLYALYALLFAHAGLSGGRISALFALWSATGLIAQIPAGALADRFSRRGALVAGGLLQGAGYVLWIVRPGFVAFAAGFVLWGLAGAFVSGAFEALLYDELAGHGAADRYPKILGQVTAIGLFAQLPSAVAATLLYSAGGFSLVGWVSVGSCVASTLVAARMPEPAHTPAGETAAAAPSAAETQADDGTPANDRAAGDEEVVDSYLGTLRAGIVEAAAAPAVRAAIVAVALLTAIDGIEEYFPLLARAWGVPTALTPIMVVGIPLTGAIGAALASAAGRFGRWSLALMTAGSALALGAASLLGRPAGLALIALFYGLYRLVLVLVEARLQERIDGTARATVTSVAALGTDLATFGLYAAWTVGGAAAVAILLLLVAAALPRLIGTR